MRNFLVVKNGLNLRPQASPPSTAIDGDIYYSSIDNKFKLYENGEWITPGERGSTLPSGTLLDFAGSTAPSGFLICAGQEISRTIYANLFSAIGTFYGYGNGTTTFNIPDLRGTIIINKIIKI